jgi:hypothetical protein
MCNIYKSFTLLQYVNQMLQIQLELLMMSGVPLETCWAFNERWKSKFCYKVASCWLFLLIQHLNLVPLEGSWHQQSKLVQIPAWLDRVAVANLQL